MRKIWLGSLLLGASLFMGACSGDDDGADPDATPPADAIGPIFDPDYRDTYTQARSCRNSASHDLHRIVVWASPDAAPAYVPQEGEMPVGSILLKEEYDFADTNCEDEILRWTLMKKLPEGQGEDTLGWWWQDLEADGTVSSENHSLCYGCHDDCDGEPERVFDDTCAVLD